MADRVEIIPGFSQEELAAEIIRLKAQAQSPAQPPVVPTAPPVQTPPPAPQPQTLKVRLGNTEVSASSPEELQRYIDNYNEQVARQLQAQQLQQQTHQPQPQDEGFNAQRWAEMLGQDPVKANDYLLKAQFGMDTTQLKQVLGMASQVPALYNKLTVSEFLRTHDDYDPTADNQAKMEAIMRQNGLAFTEQGLDIAFKLGQQAGIFAKPQEETHAPEAQTQAPAAAPVPPMLPKQTPVADLDQNLMAEVENLSWQQLRELLKSRQ